MAELEAGIEHAGPENKIEGLFEARGFFGGKGQAGGVMPGLVANAQLDHVAPVGGPRGPDADRLALKSFAVLDPQQHS